MKFILLILLFCAGIFFMAGWKQFYPLNPWDEAFFILLSGKPLATTPLDFPALYVGFIKFLRLFSDDPVQLYYLNIAVQTLGLSILVYGAGLALRLEPLLCFLLGFLVLISSLNAPIVFSKTNHFNAAYFLFLWIMTTRIPSPIWKFAAVGAGIVLSLYIRAENWVLVPCFLLWTGLSLGKSQWRKWWAVCGAVGLFGLVLGLIRSPFGEDRAWWAFSDWYFWNQKIRSGFFSTDLVVSPRNEVIQLMHQVFGDAFGLRQAFLANPVAVLQSAISNLGSWLAHLPFWLTGHFSILPFRLSRQPEIHSALEWVLLAALLTVFFVWVSRFQKERPQVQTMAVENRNVFRFFFGALLLKTLVLTSLLSAAPRYSLEWILFLALGLVSLIPSRFVSLSKRWTLALAAGLLALCPQHRTSTDQAYLTEAGDFLYNRTIEILQPLQASHELKLLCSTPIDTYLGRDQRSYTAGDFLKGTQNESLLGVHLQSRGVNVVVIDKKVGLHFREDGKLEALMDFADHAEQYGFQVVFRESHQKEWPFILLIQKNLLGTN